MSPSLLLDTLDSVYQMVDELGVSPVVAGGLAVSYWEHPRSTRDIDLAILVTIIDSFESRVPLVMPEFKTLRKAAKKQSHTANLSLRHCGFA